MGSPLGPTLDNAFLCHFEKQWLSGCPQDFCCNIYRRDFDDIFVSFNSHEQLKKFVEYMNTKHPNMKFVFEHEHSNTFSFRDVKIFGKNNKFTTSVYGKPALVEFLLLLKVLYPQFTNLV